MTPVIMDQMNTNFHENPPSFALRAFKSKFQAWLVLLFDYQLFGCYKFRGKSREE